MRFFVVYKSLMELTMAGWKLPRGPRIAKTIGLCFTTDSRGSLTPSHLVVYCPKHWTFHVPFPAGLERVVTAGEREDLKAEALRWQARMRQIAG